MTARRLLMLTQWYPPCEAWPTAATRASLFSRHFVDLGWEPIVLAPDLSGGACACRSCQTNAARADHPDDGVTVVRVPVRPSLPRRLLRRSGTTGASAPAPPPRAVSAARDLAWLLSGTNSDWPARAARRARELVSEHAPAALFTTSGPFEHLPIGRALKLEFRLPWLAELRDPASTDVTARHPLVERLVQARRRKYREDLLAADAVIGATGQVADCDGPWLGRAIEVVVTGFDSEAWAAARAAAQPDPDRFEIVFAGRLYENYRRPDVFLRGLRRFADTLTREERAGVRFVYYGRSGPLLRRLSEENGCLDLVVDNGFVAPSAVPRVLAEATVLLLLTNEEGDSGVPGGKFFEYLGAHRPVLAVPGQDQYIGGIFAETGAGVLANDESEVATQLARWHAEWKVTRSLPFRGEAAAIESFSSAGSAHRMAAVLDEMVAATEGARR